MKKINFTTIFNITLQILLVICGIGCIVFGNEISDSISDGALDGTGYGGIVLFLIIGLAIVFFYALGAGIIGISIISLIIIFVPLIIKKPIGRGVYVYHAVIYGLYLFNVITIFPAIIMNGEDYTVILVFIAILVAIVLIFALGMLLNILQCKRKKEVE